MSHKNYADQTWFGYKKYLNHFQTKFPNEIEIRQNKQNFNFWENTNHSNHKWIVTVYCAVANVGTFDSLVGWSWFFTRRRGWCQYESYHIIYITFTYYMWHIQYQLHFNCICSSFTIIFVSDCNMNQHESSLLLLVDQVKPKNSKL